MTFPALLGGACAALLLAAAVPAAAKDSTNLSSTSLTGNGYAAIATCSTGYVATRTESGWTCTNSVANADSATNAGHANRADRATNADYADDGPNNCTGCTYNSYPSYNTYNTYTGSGSSVGTVINPIVATGYAGYMSGPPSNQIATYRLADFPSGFTCNGPIGDGSVLSVGYCWNGVNCPSGYSWKKVGIPYLQGTSCGGGEGGYCTDSYAQNWACTKD